MSLLTTSDMDKDSEEVVKSEVSHSIFRCGQVLAYHVVHLVIGNYSNLERNVRYGYELEKPNWDVRLKKTEQSLAIVIYAERSYGTISYVVTFFPDDMYSEEFRLKQTDNGRCYTSILPLALVEVPDNQLITAADILEIQFRLDARQDRRIPPHLCTNSRYSQKCEDKLLENIKKADVHKQQFHNFTIKLNGLYERSVDKSVVATRCGIFDVSPKYTYANEIELEVGKSKKGMKYLTSYLYTGMLIASRGELLHVYHLAKHLGMRSLMVRIAKYLLESRNKRDFVTSESGS